MRIPFKDDPIKFNQRMLFPSSVFDLLPKDHECFVYDDIFKQIDISGIDEKYSYVGQRAYDPRLVVGILLYAYTRGVFSSRQIERRCREDLGFMYISHLHCPNFRVLSDFRKDNGEFLKACFVQSALLARELKMVSFGHVSLDGSKFKANTSKHKAMSYEFLKLREEELVAQIKDLIEQAGRRDDREDERLQDKSGFDIPAELKIKEKRLEKIRAARQALEQRENGLKPGKKIEEKKQISFADKEARIMGKKGHFEYSYNGQISVDAKSQIIVGQHLSQNPNDKEEVGPALEQIQETMGELPKKMSGDNGYLSAANLERFDEAGVDAYVAMGREDKRDARSLQECSRDVTKADFTYDEERDCFRCPGGQTLPWKRTDENGRRFYQARKESCTQCAYKGRCCKSKKGEPRTISTDGNEPLRRKMMEKMEREDSKEVYKKRKHIVEPVFGQIKNSGFTKFLLRSYRKASGEFSLVCAVHNFKKIVRAILRGEVCLKADKREPVAA